MKKQNPAIRRLALAVLYLAVFAAAVMYLRVTISVPAEGDDKLTLNGWLYDMGRMSFWQYAAQDLQARLRFFLLKEAGAASAVGLILDNRLFGLIAERSVQLTRVVSAGL